MSKKRLRPEDSTTHNGGLLPTPVRNDFCGANELVIPYKCSICARCWLFIAGSRINTCPYGGPFDGYEKR